MKESIKKIFNGLSSQYAGEYLSASDKDRVLSNCPIENRTLKKTPSISLKNDGKNHIALLCNDRTNTSVLSYVLGNASNCSVDIIFHGLHQKTETESFYKQARTSFSENKIDIRLVKLINDSVNDVKNYLQNHRTLQYLVTDSHDLLITEFLKNKNIQKQVNVPIVLIN